MKQTLTLLIIAETFPRNLPVKMPLSQFAQQFH